MRPSLPHPIHPKRCRRNKEARYRFTKVFDEPSSQQDIYTVAAEPLLQELLAFKQPSAVVMAYGVTSAGELQAGRCSAAHYTAPAQRVCVAAARAPTLSGAGCRQDLHHGGDQGRAGHGAAGAEGAVQGRCRAAVIPH